MKITEFRPSLIPFLPIVTLTSPLDGIGVIAESLTASNEGMTHSKYSFPFETILVPETEKSWTIQSRLILDGIGYASTKIVMFS